jgi:hypothetical protein
MYIYVLRRVKTLSYFIPETAPSKLDIHFFIINEQKTVFNEQKTVRLLHGMSTQSIIIRHSLTNAAVTCLAIVMILIFPLISMLTQQKPEIK